MHTSGQAPAGILPSGVEVNPNGGGGKDNLENNWSSCEFAVVCPLTFLASQYHFADLKREEEAPLNS